MSLIAKAKAFSGYLASRGIPIPMPRVIDGEGSTSKMAEIVKSEQVTNVFIVTDEIIHKLGLLNETIGSLKNAGVKYTIFDKVLPDPTVDVCDEGFNLYLSNKCDGIVCVGGGSVMDCAKLIACRASNPSKPSKDFMGTFTLSLSLARIPPLIAVPTTAGTGSECTIAAVITFPLEKKKYTVIDPKICPRVAVLDPKLLVKLPKSVTAATGIDALTHAVEAYCSVWRSELTSKYSLNAIKLIFKYLPTSYENGNDLKARNELLKASYDAGIAFTRANVGYVHAIAHQFGALFHTPHGVANAMVLPYILDFYLDTCSAVFADMAIAAEIGVKSDGEQVLAKRFVEAVKKLTKQVEIPTFVKGLSQQDVSVIATRALNEAHGDTYSFYETPMKYMLDTGYPIPKYLSQAECEQIVAKLVDPQAKLHAHL